MKQSLLHTVLLLFSFIIFTSTVYSQSGWFQQNPFPPNERYLAVSFTDANTGTAVGVSDSGGVILHTINGGATWTNQTSGSTNALEDVSFTDGNTGTVVGWKSSFNWIGGFILRTTDGGGTWSIDSSTTSFFYGVSFTDADTGTVVGLNGTILRTTNGGATWTSDTLRNILNAVSFTDADTGTVVGDGGIILRTTNGGTTWTSQSSGTTNILEGVCLTDANTGTAVGANGTILRTITGGVTTVKDKPVQILNQFALEQNYPNPFNPSTTIKYDLTKQSNVKLEIYDILGRKIAILVDEAKKAGSYQISWNANRLASGVYFYRLQAGDYSATKKLLLLK